MERASIRKLKLPDATGVWGGYVVARDEHGTWFFTPAGSPILWTNLAGKDTVWSFDVLCLIPPAEWWFALWWGPSDHDIEVSVDVTAPATRVGQEWSWVDLEIDLYRRTDGTVGIEDEDEFADSCAAGWISERERIASLRVTPVVERMLRDYAEPFGKAGPRWLAAASELGLAPLEPRPAAD